MPKLLNVALLSLAVVIGSSSAQADEYVSPTYPNLVKMLVRFGALDIRDNDAIDSYALVVECKLYHHFVANDFKWHDIQDAIRKSIKQDITTFPTGLTYKSQLQLDRYDFKKNLYLFNKKSAPLNVNLFSLQANMDRACDSNAKNLIPKRFQIVLEQSVSLPGIPLSEEEGKLLLKRMKDSGNKDHAVYANFNMRITYIAPVQREKKQDKGEIIGMFIQPQRGDVVRLDAHLTSIDIYEDKDRKKLLYRYETGL